MVWVEHFSEECFVCSVVKGETMPRYIDADALEELFREVIGGIAKRPEMNGNLEHMIRASAMVIEMIKDAQTADVVEVVRCKDCIFSKRDMDVHPDPKILNKDRWCELYGRKSPGWFCADAERRE